MAKKIYDSVLARLAVEIPLFAEPVLYKALSKIGTNPSQATAFQLKDAIEGYVEPILRENFGFKKSIQEIGAGIIIVNNKGKIRKITAAAKRLIPNWHTQKFQITRELVSETVQSKNKFVKILTIPLISESEEIEGAVCIVSDITLDIELNEEMNSTYEKLKKNQAELAEKVEDLEKFSKVAVGRELKMVELKKEIKRLEKKVGEG